MFGRLMALALLLLIAGCDSVDTLRSGMENGNKVSADIEKAIGVGPFVGYNWRNGSLSNVSLTFQQAPRDLDWATLESAARQSIRKHFKQEPDAIVISFMLPGRLDKDDRAESAQSDSKKPI